jgi:hypothetical protein
LGGLRYEGATATAASEAWLPCATAASTPRPRSAAAKVGLLLAYHFRYFGGCK